MMLLIVDQRCITDKEVSQSRGHVDLLAAKHQEMMDEFDSYIQEGTFYSYIETDTEHIHEPRGYTTIRITVKVYEHDDWDRYYDER